jgi:hypothetical protein
MNQHFGTCRLCLRNGQLMRSHVIPRFVIAWLRQMGALRLYSVLSPRRPIQDSPKRHLLCVECEQRFAVWERWFAEQVLRRPDADWYRGLDYGPDLYLFGLSVLWRIAETGAHLWSETWPTYATDIQVGREHWRSLLLGNAAQSWPVHIFVTRQSPMALMRPVPGFDDYMVRFSDGTLAGGKRRVYAFAKFAHFLLFAPVAGAPFELQFFENTLIEPAGGHLAWASQWIGDVDFTGMLVGRMEALHAARAAAGLPPIR